MKSIRAFLLMPCAAAALLAGCAMGPSYQRPEIAAPSNWRTPGTDAASLANTEWWGYYRDPVLTNLIATALTNNYDLRIAAARIEEARGGYRAQRSFLLPSIGGSANWTRARAAYFPTVSLTAALGVQSVQLDDLFSAGTSRAWKLAPQIAGPIFNGGRIRAGVQVAKARQKAALAFYEQAIQNAFREVEDALVSITKLREELASEEANVKVEQRRLELSQLRYDEGIASFSDVLDAQRFQFSAELTAVQTRNNLLAAVAQLYKALGGGWTTSPVRTGKTP